jgi:cysteine-rich repeat protein
MRNAEPASVSSRDTKPARVSSRDIPLPFGGGTTSALRGQITDIGSTNDNRAIVDMTFDNGEVSEKFTINALSFVLTPAASASFSSGAPLSVAITAGKKLYGYKYTTRDAAIETAVNDEMEASQGTPKIFYYADRFPGTFFAPAAELNDPTSDIAKFIAEKNEVDHMLDVASTEAITLEADARYLIIAEAGEIPAVAGDTIITVRGLTWCGDSIVQASSEACDSGSMNGDGNGCSSTCDVEPDWFCEHVNSADPTSRSVCRTCSDDDQTNDANVAGTVTQLNQDGSRLVEPDRCDSGNANVLQFLCNASNVATQVVPPTSCPYGCANGICLSATCGDNQTQPSNGEQCDDGAQNTTTCTAPYAGTCSYCEAVTCQNKTITGPRCGDGTPQTGNGEQCDNGAQNTTTCTAAYGQTCNYCEVNTCQSKSITGPYCGDGTPQTAGADGIVNTADDEECDAGVNNGYSTCSATCKLTVPLAL